MEITDESECSLSQKDSIPVDDLRDIEFKKKQMIPEVIAREYAFNPEGSKQLLLTAPAQKPPLILEGPTSDPAVYDMGPENAGRVMVDLRLRSADDEGRGFDIFLPLKMLTYKTPDDPRMCFDLPTCHKVDAVNESVERHNKYITSLLSIFVRENGCGTSANHITLPSPPDVMALTRIKRLEGIFKDKYSSIVLAVRYLTFHGKICGPDYDIEKAVDAANDVAFEVGIQKKMAVDKDESKSKSASRRIRFRIRGSPAAFWSGVPEERDSVNRRVQWKRGEHHSFLSPEIEVGLANDELLTV